MNEVVFIKKVSPKIQEEFTKIREAQKQIHDYNAFGDGCWCISSGREWSKNFCGYGDYRCIYINSREKLF